MLHWWLIPAMAVLFAILCVLYLVIKGTGGSGVRTDGRTVVDKPVDEEDLPSIQHRAKKSLSESCRLKHYT